MPKTMMKSILFNTEMVRAILEGRKTVTRRVVRRKYCDSEFEIFKGQLCEASQGKLPRDNRDGTTTRFIRAFVPCKAPYNPGDILYVRETWAHPSGIEVNNGADPQMYLYKADVIKPAAWDKWRPSIHMPREAARIFLRVTAVRVERLKKITPEQIDAEGCKEWAYSAKTGELLPSEPSWFKIAWDNTIKPTDRALYGWEANPWVWVIEFERITKEEAE